MTDQETTETVEHTPTPWQLSEPWSPPNSGQTIEGPDDAYIADVYAGHHPDDVVDAAIGRANATFIAHACNNHDALLHTCSQLYNFAAEQRNILAEGGHVHIGSKSFKAKLDAFCEEARVVLENATKEE